MKRLLGAIVAGILISVINGQARGDEKEAQAILDKAIKAIGGEEKLSKINAFSWKSKSVMNFGGNEAQMDISETNQGLDRLHAEAAGNFNGNEAKILRIVNGNKGWFKFNDMTREMEGDMLANQKQAVYLQFAATLIAPLKGKEFKIDTAGEEKVGDKPATVLKVTGPDGKNFKLLFDKESGLPVKQVTTVKNPQGGDVDQETTFADYKDFDGIKKATKITGKRNGEQVFTHQISEFKILDKVDEKLFQAPE